MTLSLAPDCAPQGSSACRPTCSCSTARCPACTASISSSSAADAALRPCGYSKGKRELDAAAGLADWTLHDLRRTAATGMARLGIAPHVVERVLNHVSGTFAGVAGIYNRFRYEDEMRQALEAWDSHVKKLVA